MSSAITILLQDLASSRRLMLDAVRDLSATELTRRPTPDLRSCAEILGMAVVAEREVLHHLGATDLPAVPAGFEARFARWGTGEDGETGYHGTLPEIFASHRNVLARATGRLDPANLDEPVDPPDHLDEEALFRFGTVGEMILTLSAYTCFLAGEASAIRLALGRAAVDDPLERAIEKAATGSCRRR
jgi:DinB superfamily